MSFCAAVSLPSQNLLDLPSNLEIALMTNRVAQVHDDIVQGL